MKNRHIFLLLCLIARFAAPVAAQFTLNPVPAKIYGQFAAPKTVQDLASPPSVAPNLVEGREFYAPQSVALDKSVDPPILYVADTGNHRVLAWKDASAFQTGAVADLVLGQKDFYSTNPQGPGTAFTSGLYGPTSVAVDALGNVFVADAGNNRILRFPAPFAQPAGQAITADLVIGQPDLNSRFANQAPTATANQAPTASTIRTNGYGTGGIQSATLTFDAQGNLWFSDSGNHRILRYAAADVSGAANTAAGGAVIAANLVLGQPDFNTAAANQGRVTQPSNQLPDRLSKSSLRFGGPLAFDASGNLFFADDLARVLVWTPPFESNKPASRILGIYLQKPGEALLPPVNDMTFGYSLSSANIFGGGPQGLFCIGDYLFVSDTIFNRIVRYDPVSTWPAEDLANYTYSPRMSAVFGQADFNSREPNGGSTLEPTSSTVNGPLAAAYWNGHVFLADSRNNRVLDLGYATDANLLAPASRVLGQYEFALRAPNLIEGREISSGSLPLLLANGSVSALTLGPAAVIDRTSDTPHLFVADTGNNRILGFWDARRVKYGDTADLIIGQVGPTRNLINSPTNDATKPTATGLLLPSSVAVDAEGNVWVADTGNGRVLRFPRPYDHWGDTQTADVVIGQPDFETRPAAAVSRDRLYRPSSIAFTGDGNLVVADLAHSRVLMFNAPFTSGAAATLVLGQPDDATATPGSGESQMNLPLGVAVDTDDRLYVADTGNNRVLIFGRVTTQTDGAAAALILPLGAQGATPASVTVSARSGQIWVADVKGSRVLRFPRFDQIFFDPGQKAEYSFNTYFPRQIVLDGQDYIFVVDGANRITMHYPLHGVVNGGSGFPRVAPGMLALLQAPGVRFAAESAAAGGAPLPKELADVELLVDGMAAPITSVEGDRIRFLVPKDTSTSGTADFLVRRVSTGQILAENRIPMSVASPAVLYQGVNPATQAPARAYNQDGSLNTAGRPAASNEELTVYLTGQGAVPGMPEDGTAAEVPVGDVRAFILAGTQAAEAQVISSALDAAEPGVWKVKVKLPQVPLNGTYGFAVIYRTSFSSNSYTSGSTVLRVNPLISINK
jgi:uncharacterized protein (TIGR03437 family)